MNLLKVKMNAIALGHAAIYDAADNHIANVFGSDSKYSDARSYAYLFTAAPEMYEAVSAASDFLHACPNDGTDEKFNALLKQLRSAEAAAKGAQIRS
jgi:hypothetical protein